MKYVLFCIAKFMIFCISLHVCTQANAQIVQYDIKNVLENEIERLSHLKKEYSKIEETGDSIKIAKICYDLGKKYNNTGNFYESQKWFIKSLKFREPFGPSHEIGMTYVFMNDFLIYQEKYFESRDNLKNAMNNFFAVNSMHGIMSGYLALASTYQLANKLSVKKPELKSKNWIDSSLCCYEKALNIAKDLKKPLDLANIYQHEGNLFLHVAPEKSVLFLNLANSILLKYKSNSLYVHNLLLLGNAYINLKKYKQANELIKKAETLMDSVKAQNYQHKLHLTETYFRFFNAQGNWEKALNYKSKHYELLVSSINTDRDGAVARIRLEYETEKKESQIKSQQKAIMISIIVGAFILLCCAILFIFFKKYKRLSLINAELVSEQNHRVKNNLQQVTNLINLQTLHADDEKVRLSMNETLLRVESMLLVHQDLYKSERLIEINLLNYLKKLARGILTSFNYLQITPSYQGEEFLLHIDQAITLGLILNELLTNVCKYGLKNNHSPIITIECRQINGFINFKIKENGPGFDFIKYKNSFGLSLIQKFVYRLKGEYQFMDFGREFNLTFKKQSVLQKAKPI